LSNLTRLLEVLLDVLKILFCIPGVFLHVRVPHVIQIAALSCIVEASDGDLGWWVSARYVIVLND